MIQVNRVSRAELERQSREQYAKTLGLSDSGREQTPARVVNAREAAGLDRPTVFAFRGTPYILPPIPYEAGIELHEVRSGWEMSRVGNLDNDEYRRLSRRAVRLMGALAHRRGWRWARWIRPNPFRNASEREIGQLLDFFWTCRTGLRFPLWLARRMTTRERLTQSTPSPTSFGSSTHGPSTASPDHGGTTSTG